jgi:DegV family protein with EDD domain
MDKKILLVTADNVGIKLNEIPYPYVEYLKFPVFIGEEEYKESETYTGAWLIDRYRKEKIFAKSSSLHKTDILDIVERNKDKYDLIVMVLMNSKMTTATYNMVHDIQEKYKDQIPIINIDSRQVVEGVGALLLRLVDFIKENNNAEDIINYANTLVSNTFSYYVIPDMEYLYRGGRIGKAKALMGSVLRIIPVVGLLGDDPDGEVVPIGQGRTLKQVNSIVINAIKEKMEEKKANEITVAVISGDETNMEAIENFKKEIENSLPIRKLVMGQLHLIEATYLGPGGYGIGISLK